MSADCKRRAQLLGGAALPRSRNTGLSLSFPSVFLLALFSLYRAPPLPPSRPLSPSPTVAVHGDSTDYTRLKHSDSRCVRRLNRLLCPSVRQSRPPSVSLSLVGFPPLPPDSGYSGTLPCEPGFRRIRQKAVFPESGCPTQITRYSQKVAAQPRRDLLLGSAGIRVIDTAALSVTRMASVYGLVCVRKPWRLCTEAVYGLVGRASVGHALNSLGFRVGV